MKTVSMKCRRMTSKGCPFFSYIARKKNGSITMIMLHMAMVFPP